MIVLCVDADKFFISIAILVNIFAVMYVALLLAS